MTATALDKARTSLDMVEQLARRWVARDFTVADIATVFKLAHDSWPPAKVWPLFEDLAEQVDLYDRFESGHATWRDVNEDIVGPDPTDQATSEICCRVDAAARALVYGRAA